MAINILCYVHKGDRVFIFKDFKTRLYPAPDSTKDAIFHFSFASF